MVYVLGKNSKRNREGIDPRWIEISDLAIVLTLIDFGHGPDSGLRTAGRQNALFKDGDSKADGYANKSDHQTGKALDFHAYVNGAGSWKREHLAMVAAAVFQAASVLGYRVEWGGLWPSKNGGIYGWDMAHFSLVDL